MTEIEDKISASILRIRMRMPFFGVLALFLRHRLDPRVPTACTDGKEVIFNPEFADKLSNPELDAVMVHELLHTAMLHIPRRQTRDPLRWNIAADIVVNGIIRKEKSLNLPQGACINPKWENYQVEEVYKLLGQNLEKYSLSWIGQDLLAGDGKLSPSSAKTSSPDPSDESDWKSAVSKEEIEAHWKQAWQEASTLAASFAQGDLPAEILMHLQEVTDPALDWRTLLWRYLVRTPSDFSGFDRRHIGRGLYLEALEGESVSARIAIDTSGSVCGEELVQFVAEVREILRLYPQIDAQLYYADAALYGPFDINDESLTHPVGGGGTCFKPFFKEMEKTIQYLENSVLIYLTDGYGTFPETEPDQPVLWVVTAGGLPSHNFPFGSVARLIT